MSCWNKNTLHTSCTEIFGQIKKITGEINGFFTWIFRISQQKKTENGELWNKTENEKVLWYDHNCNFSNLVFNNIKGKKDSQCFVYMQSTFALHKIYFIYLKNSIKIFKKKDIRFSPVLISILVAFSVADYCFLGFSS